MVNYTLYGPGRGHLGAHGNAAVGLSHTEAKRQRDIVRMILNRDPGTVQRRLLSATRIDPLASDAVFNKLLAQKQLHQRLALSRLEGRNIRGGVYLEKEQVRDFEPTPTGSALIDELVRRGAGPGDIGIGERGQIMTRGFFPPRTRTTDTATGETTTAGGAPRVNPMVGQALKWGLGIVAAAALTRWLTKR